MRKLRAYVATKISNLNNGLILARSLEGLGIEVTSSWMGCHDRPERGSEAWQEFCRKWAAVDVADVLRSDLVVVLSVPGCVGTLFEWGVAWGTNKTIHFVGDREFTVFSRLELTPDGTPIHYHDDAMALVEFLAKNPIWKV